MRHLKQKLINRAAKVSLALTGAALLLVISAPLSLTYAAGGSVGAAAGGSAPSPGSSTTTPNGSSTINTCPTATAGSNNNGSCEDPAVQCTNNKCDLVAKYVNPMLKLLAAVFGTIAVISVIAGGIQYTSSSGDPQKVAEAKKRLVNTIIAVVAFLFMYAFLQFLIPGGIFNRPLSG